MIKSIRELCWHNRLNLSIIGEKFQHNTLVYIQPSSAAAEQVFSLLQISFTKRQQSSSVMMQYELSPFLYDVVKFALIIIFLIFTIVMN